VVVVVVPKALTVKMVALRVEVRGTHQPVRPPSNRALLLVDLVTVVVMVQPLVSKVTVVVVVALVPLAVIRQTTQTGQV
jgi:hypothetical protein